MSSLQYKIWLALLRANYRRNDRKESHDLHLGKAWEMPVPPRILKRRNKIEEFSIESRSVFTCHPEKLTSKKVILYFHGGGYYTRTILPHWLFIRKLSNRFGMKVILPDYPTAPVYNYLQTYNFAIQTYQNLIRSYDPKDIYFFGDSAGGGLALTLAQGIKKESLPQAAGLFLLSPWLDVSMTNPEIKDLESKDYMLSLDSLLIAAQLFAEEADLKNPIISPLYDDLAGLPEIYLFIGTRDILLPDCRKFQELARAAGTRLTYLEYDDMVHCWMLFPIPEAKSVLNKIQEYLVP